MTPTRRFELGSPDGALPFTPIDADGLAIALGPDGRIGLARATSARSAARVVADARGLVLEVGIPSPVHVNGRPVRERALLRPGDRIVLGGTALVVRTTEPPPEAGPVASPEDAKTAHDPWTLRCLTGRHAGQTRPVATHPRLPWESRGSGVAELAVARDGVALRATSAMSVVVDGHVVTSALLSGGEQLVVADDHYVLDGAAGRTMLRAGSRGRASPRGRALDGDPGPARVGRLADRRRDPDRAGPGPALLPPLRGSRAAGRSP
jgi:hypothetical protein